MEKYNEFKESAHFTKLKAGGKFAIYALGIYLAATVAIGCLGLIIGSFPLTLPLAMLIFHPVAWILMGIVLEAAYKMVVEPLFHLVKGYVDGKGTVKEEKSPKEQKFTRSKSLDSGLDTISRKTDDLDKRVRRNSYSPSTDSGIVPGSEPDSSNNSRRNSNVSGDSGINVNLAGNRQHKVVTYSTTGDGNCFFHAMFGDNSSSAYKAERAQDMRMEWHKFFSQFNSLDDARMPAPLKAQLGKVFNMFLNKLGDLTGRSDRIKELAERTSKELVEVKKRVELLKEELVKHKFIVEAGLTRGEVESNLQQYAVQLKGLTVDGYNNQYNSEFVTCSFLNKPELYQAYLEAIISQNYFIFIEEIPILASLANTEIDVYYENNGNDVNTVFKPNAGMINEGYQRNNELWGDKKQETIYLTPGHYERAEIIEVEPSLMEKVSSAIQGVAAVCVNALGLNT